MPFPAYTFEASALTFTPTARLQPTEAASIVSSTFKFWLSTDKGSSTFESANVLLRATLTQRTEGRSEAEVYELTFLAFDAQPVSRFIARIYYGVDALQNAEHERTLVERIKTTGLDRFASKLCSSPQLPKHVLVYRHVDDQLGSEAKSLEDSLKRMLQEKDSAGITNLGCEFDRMLSDIARASKAIDPDVYQTARAKLLDQRRDRLAPDLLLDVRGRQPNITASRIVVPTAGGDVPARPEDIPLQTISGLVEQMSGLSPQSPAPWVKLSVLRLPTKASSILRFRSRSPATPSPVLWARSDDPGAFDQDASSDDARGELIFRPTDCSAATGAKAIRNLGFKDGVLTRHGLPDLVPGVKTLLERMDYTDLHTGNLLYGARHLKVIDLVSFDKDVLAVAHARLELSLWRCIGRSLELGGRDIHAILTDLGALQTPGSNPPNWGRWATVTLLLPIRQSLAQIKTDSSEAHDAVRMAYALQAGYHQRYLLENEESAGLVFASVASQFLKAALEPPTTATPLAASDGASDTEPETRDPRIPETPPPTLSRLWEAICSRGNAGVPARSRRLLSAVRGTRSALMDLPLTELQMQLLGPAGEPKFASNDHIILSGPTASGKSTVADAFLASPSLLNSTRRSALYIAPTRALAQVKHRELVALFANDKELQDGCVLSTGEDRDHDWRIVHGQFFVACMVYEKANILFSRNRRLLEGLGCVVVDEGHMLSDIERGPILELVLTKVLRARREDDVSTGRIEKSDYLRVVVISTEEDTSESAFGKFMSREDARGGLLPPSVFHSAGRPVKVHHYLVLPDTGSEDYRLFPIAEFGAGKRVISPQDLCALDQKLEMERRRMEDTSVGIRHISYDSNQEIRSRATALTLGLVRDRPRGFRILIFVPGRADAEELACRLKNKVKNLRLPPVNPEIVDVLDRVLEETEDSQLARTLRVCAAQGIFVHHADVDRKVRERIELLCRSVASECRTEIIVATETLSYGVNLGVNDVILVGTMFHSQTRMRVFQDEALAICAYHNMCGRAGRLGYRTETPGVYVLTATHEKPIDVVKKYYLKHDRAVSRIFVSEDRQALLRLESNRFAQLDIADGPCGKYTGLGPLDLSYPFVRSVLDALRHLNMRTDPTVGDLSARRPVDLDTVLEFFNSTAYVKQTADPAGEERELELFRCAVQQTLEGCSEKPLHLVKKTMAARETVYAITPRGEAVIDTGTELRTVAPVLRLVGEMESLWSDSEARMPVELYVLCLLGQQEIFRRCLRYAPECRRKPQRGWPGPIVTQNRGAILADLRESLSRCGEPSGRSKAMAAQIRKVLDGWQPIGSVSAAYTNGGTDSVVRFFNAFIAWVNGDELANVMGHVENTVVGSEYGGRLQGWRRLTELLSWKALFLAKMLSTAKAEDVAFEAAQERELHCLAARLRLGCTAEAVPLFWPQSSDLKRRHAVLLIKEGMTPGRIASLSGPQQSLEQLFPTILPDIFDELRRDLEGLARKEFLELRSEMTAVPAGSPRSQRVHMLWNRMAELFEDSVEAFTERTDGRVDFDGKLRASLDPGSWGEEDEAREELGRGALSRREGFRVTVGHAAGDGLVLRGETVGSERQDFGGAELPGGMTVRIVGVEMRRDWRCSVGGREWRGLAETLEEFEAGHLALVAMPWTPYHGEMPTAVSDAVLRRAEAGNCGLSVLTPAAFAVMMTALLRGFTSGRDLMVLLTSGRSSDSLSIVGVNLVQTTLQKAGVAWPESIRERLIEHFEVDPTIATNP